MDVPAVFDLPRLVPFPSPTPFPLRLSQVLHTSQIGLQVFLHVVGLQNPAPQVPLTPSLLKSPTNPSVLVVSRAGPSPETRRSASPKSDPHFPVPSSSPPSV